MARFLAILSLLAVLPGLENPPTTNASPDATPAGHGPYDENEWLVTQVASDIAEMVLSVASRGGHDGASVSAASVAGAPGSYDIHVWMTKGVPPLSSRITLSDHVWAPSDYADYARLLLKSFPSKPSGVSTGVPASTLSALVQLTPATLQKENERLSGWLGRDMLNPVAQEQAGFLLGAFAFREEAGGFSDARPALCGMAAHLALARALRGASPPSPDGEYAGLLLTTLIGRQRQAVEEIALLRKGPTTAAQKAWLNALGMRNTGDFRIVPLPAQATPLEFVEYVRALRRSQENGKSSEFLGQQRVEPTTDIVRIALEGTFSVEEGNTFALAAIGLELQELSLVWKLVSGSPLAEADVTKVLNLPPGRCVWHPGGAELGPRVINRGLWAAFAQRHLLSAVEIANHHVGQKLALQEDAVAFRAKATKLVGSLTLFPRLKALWEGTPLQPRPGASPVPPDPQWGRCPSALDLVRARPELVTATFWNDLGTQCFRARAERILPDPSAWFTTGTPRGTLYDLDRRSHIPSILKITQPEVDRLLSLAPYDKTLIVWRISFRPPDTEISEAEFKAIYGSLPEYDARAQRDRTRIVRADDATLKAEAKRTCEANADQCLAVASKLVSRGATAEAVAAYERAIERANDRVAVSISCGWLVQYYFEAGRTDRALEVAQMAAKVYSEQGLETLAQLLERMGRYEEAESTYKALVARYPDQQFLLPIFYIRREYRIPDGRFKQQAAAAEQEVFPAGRMRMDLARMPAPRPGMSEKGYPVQSDWGPSYKALGVRIGDMVLVVDGYRVSNKAQFLCIAWLTDEPEISLIVQRQGGYFELKGKADRRLYGPRVSAPKASP